MVGRMLLERGIVERVCCWLLIVILSFSLVIADSPSIRSAAEVLLLEVLAFLRQDESPNARTDSASHLLHISYHQLHDSMTTGLGGSSTGADVEAPRAKEVTPERQGEKIPPTTQNVTASQWQIYGRESAGEPSELLSVCCSTDSSAETTIQNDTDIRNDQITSPRTAARNVRTNLPLGIISPLGEAAGEWKRGRDAFDICAWVYAARDINMDDNKPVGRKLRTKIDTGASLSCITEAAVGRLGKQYIVPGAKRQLQGLGNVWAKGEISLKIRVQPEGQYYKMPFQVLPHLSVLSSYDVILGRDSIIDMDLLRKGSGWPQPRHTKGDQ